MNPKKIGNFIVELRKIKGLTQKELATSVHIGREAISKWERGLTIPDTSALLMLSVTLGVSVNELLNGERRTSKNKDEIDKTALKIMDLNRIKIKKTRVVMGAIIFICVFLFFIYYFLYNFSSIKVYITAGESKSFSLDQGLIVASKQKFYIKFGEVSNRTKEEIESITFYYEKDDVKKELLKTDKLSGILFDLYGYGEFFGYDTLPRAVDNLYLDIETENITETLKINAELDFTNNYILPLIIQKNVEELKPKTTKEVIIPEFVKKNFDDQDGFYTYKYKNKYDNYFIMLMNSGSLIHISQGNRIMLYDLNTKTIEYTHSKSEISTYNCNLHISAGNMSDEQKNELKYLCDDLLLDIK